MHRQRQFKVASKLSIWLLSSEKSMFIQLVVDVFGKTKTTGPPGVYRLRGTLGRDRTVVEKDELVSSASANDFLECRRGSM